MLSADNLAGIPSLVAIRMVATVVFAGLYLRDRKPLHLFVLTGWLLYAFSAVLLLTASESILPIAPEMQFVLAAAVAYLGTAVLMLSAACYVHLGVLRAAPSISVLMLILIVPGFLLSNLAEVVVFFTALQGFAFLIGACVLWFERRSALKNLSHAYYGLALVTVAGLLQIGFVLTGYSLPNLSMFVTAGITLIWLLVFIFAEHNEIMEKLRQSSIRLGQAENLSKIGYWERNVVTEQAYWSSGHYKVFGVPEDQPPLSSEEMYSIMHPEDVEDVRRVYRRVQQGSPYEYHEFRVVLPDGEVRWIKSDTTQQEGAEHWVFGVTQDITERKLVELRVEQAFEEKSAQLEAVVLGLPKTLYTIMDLLHAVQSHDIADSDHPASLRKVQQRVLVLLKQQQRILRTGFSLSAPSYMKAICESFSHEPECEVDDFIIDPEFIVPVGLIVQELLSNAFVHGTAAAPHAPDQAAARAKVSLSCRIDGGDLFLAVQDNGPGFKPEFLRCFEDNQPGSGISGLNGGGLGFVVVRTLATQINARLTVLNREGARVELRVTPEGQRYS